MLSRSKAPESLPLPEEQMRALTGQPNEDGWTHAPGTLVFPKITDPALYKSVLDFGSGCGRNARKLAFQHKPAVGQYVGLDLHKGMIDWSNQNLAPVLPNFQFIHHNVYNAGFNPDPKLPSHAAFPIEDESVSLIIGHSVFTHLLQEDAEFYLDEVRRVLAPNGVAMLTWFIFEKRYFPMMQDFQNALFINSSDPTNAVIFDRAWLSGSLSERGLIPTTVTPPGVRGFQWELLISRTGTAVELPEDQAPFGHVPPPVLSVSPHTIR